MFAKCEGNKAEISRGKDFQAWEWAAKAHVGCMCLSVFVFEI